MTSFELAQNHKGKQLPDKNHKFSFNYWIDVSRVDEIHSLIEYSIIDVEFEISFADEDTKQSYERYVDRLKTDLSTTYDVSKNDIVTITTFEMVLHGLLFGKRFHYIVDLISLFPLTKPIICLLYTSPSPRDRG